MYKKIQNAIQIKKHNMTWKFEQTPALNIIYIIGLLVLKKQQQILNFVSVLMKVPF